MLVGLPMVTMSDVLTLAMTLPLSHQALVRGRVKFRVGSKVYLSFSRDETLMGFAFPKEERDWLVGGNPGKFLLPEASDLRYNWVLVRLASIGDAEMRELVLDAWRMVVPRRVATAYDLSKGVPTRAKPKSAPAKRFEEEVNSLK